MKHKVGDVVQIKSLDWYNKKRKGHPNIIITSSITFNKEMSSYCGKKLKIKSVHGWGYFLDIDEYKKFCWTDDMFEDEVCFEETPNIEEKEITEKTNEGIENIRELEGISQNTPEKLHEINDNKEVSEDMVNHPSHYTWLKDKCGIEVIDITRHLDFDLGNSVKYILRSNHKHDASMSDKEKSIQDLEKAIFYLKDEINMINNSK